VTSHDCDETLPPLGNFLRTPLQTRHSSHSLITPNYYLHFEIRDI